MIAIICAALSGLGFYFSIGLGEQWWLAWLAPIPILWLAFEDTKGWTVFLLSWAACTLGGSNIIRAYGGTLPVFVLALGICGPALLFAVDSAVRFDRSDGRAHLGAERRRLR
jgi:apolipoprotein N-acyltransferase